jgi:outer membrane lipoprotein-sorting protein
VIVSDGRHFWVHYPSVDARQVIRAPASQAGAGGVDLKSQFVGDPVARFQATLEGREAVAGRDAHILTLVPRAPAGYRRLRVWIDARDHLVRRFEIHEANEVVRRFELRNLELNPRLGDDLFRFTPPTDARIIDQG